MTSNNDLVDASWLALPTGNQPVFLFTSKALQRCHQRWWTALPAIPATRNSPTYLRLWRHFADHTMNTFKRVNGRAVPGNRGFYVEGREDHLVPAFFENFTMCADFGWLEQLLDRLAIPYYGGITNAAWSYSYSELIQEMGRPHADIVLMWRDHRGSAVLVIEAKRPGGVRGGIGVKDHPENRHYLHYSAMKGIERRSQALLIDARDRPNLPQGLDGSPSVVTWQDLIDIQQSMLPALGLDRKTGELLEERLSAHYVALGLASGNGYVADASASEARYAVLRALEAPDLVKDWLVGSELFFGIRNGSGLVKGPYGWLDTELTIFDYALEKRQSTADREYPFWHLDKVAGH